MTLCLPAGEALGTLESFKWSLHSWIRRRGGLVVVCAFFLDHLQLGSHPPQLVLQRVQNTRNWVLRAWPGLGLVLLWHRSAVSSTLSDSILQMHPPPTQTLTPTAPGLIPGNTDTSVGLCFSMHRFLVQIITKWPWKWMKKTLSLFIAGSGLAHSWYVVNSGFPILLFSLHQELLIGLLFVFWSIKALNEALLVN